MIISANHHLRYLVDVYLDGKKVSAAYAANTDEGWVDIARIDWVRRANAGEAIPGWNGRRFQDVPIERRRGEVRVTFTFKDDAGIEVRMVEAV